VASAATATALMTLAPSRLVRENLMELLTLTS
jgi:hypothetical protein